MEMEMIALLTLLMSSNILYKHSSEVLNCLAKMVINLTQAPNHTLNLFFLLQAPDVSS